MFDVYVDPALISYAGRARRRDARPRGARPPELADYISFGASPRGPISLVQAARALALVRGRDYVVVDDVRALAKDALRHRLVLSYQALAGRRHPRPDPRLGGRRRPRAGGGPLAVERRMNISPLLGAATPARPGPGALPLDLLRALQIEVGRRLSGCSPATTARRYGDGVELAQVRPYDPGDDVRQIDWNVTARTGEPHVRVHLAERVLVTWLVLDTSPSMRFGTADRRKADVAEGVAIAVGHVATRRGNRLGVVDLRRPAARDAAAAPGTRRADRPARGCGASRSRSASARRRSATRCAAPARSRASAASSSSSPTSAARSTGASRCSS